MVNLETQLGQLETARLVNRLSEPELAYLFKHALVQDTAYQSVLLRKRRAVHRAVAQAYEQLYADRLDEFAGLLVYHYGEAGAEAQVLPYAVRAADLAAQTSANPEARAYYDRALAALEHLPTSLESRRLRIDLMVKRVPVALRSEGPHRSLERMLEAEALAQGLLDESAATPDDRLRLARIRYWIGQAYLHANQIREALGYLREVFSFGQSGGGGLEFVAVPSSMIGRALLVQGHFDQAEPFLVQAVKLLEDVPNLHERTFAGGMLGVNWAMRGHYQAGLEQAKRTRDRALASDHVSSRALSEMCLSLLYLTGGDNQSSLEASRATIDAARQADDRVVAYVGTAFLGWAQCRLGDYASAANNLGLAADVLQKFGGRLVFVDLLAVAQAELALATGHPDDACVLARRAAELGESMGGIFSQGLAHRVWGQALAALPAPQRDEAQTHFKSGLEFFEAGDAALEVARTHLVYGKIVQANGDKDAARPHLEQAAARFRAAGLTREFGQARELLEAPLHL